MKRLVVIEDERALRDDLVDVLTEAGYAVRSAADGKAGLSLVLEETPDLVICDRLMPIMSGFDVLDALRRDRPDLDALPFVFLTAYNNLAAMSLAKTRGAAEYITKPFEFEYLVARIKQLLPV